MTMSDYENGIFVERLQKRERWMTNGGSRGEH